MNPVKPRREAHADNKGTGMSLRAVRVTALYTIFGIVWILFSDYFADWLVRQYAFLNFLALEITKGILYVLGTAILVYWLANRAFHDIRVQVLEEQLREAENLLQNILANVGDAVLIIEPPPRTIRACNRAVFSVFGYEVDELVNRQWTILYKDPETFERFRQNSEPILEEKEIFRCHCQMKHKNGSVIETETTLVTLQKELGWQGGVLCIVRDMTEEVRAREGLHRSEEQYRLLADNSLDVIWSMNMDYEITYVNSAIRQLGGYAPEEFIGMHLKDFSSEKKYAELGEEIKQEVKKGPDRSGTVVESELIRKDGTAVPVEIHGKVLFDEEGRPTGMQGVTRDISERLELEAQVRQSQKLEALGILAGGIAHDFNNILGIIIGYADLAKADVPPGTQLERDLQNVMTASNRAKELVKQILAFSRQARVERLPLKLPPFIREGLKMLRSSLPATIKIVEDIDMDVGIILADPTQVHQILMNLCTNAYHAMEEKGGALTVGLKETVIPADNPKLPEHMHGRQYVELAVSDTGSGIPEDMIEQIFDPFFSTKEVGKGTGMGLSIIHGIITEYSGAITVDSVPGEGSTFRVYFPVIKKSVLPAKEVEEYVPTGNEKILFIDDEKLLTDMSANMLEKLGYQVTTRQNGIEGFEAFKSAPEDFDLIITDQIMPEMTGTELAEQILRIRPDMPIILCTGYSNVLDNSTVKAMGIRELALKPVTHGDLAGLIRKVLDNAKSDQMNR